MTQNNLGNALPARARGPRGGGVALLAEAAAAYRAALEVRTRAAHPVDWAMTQENLGLVLEAMGDRGTTTQPSCYAEALACFDAALEVFGAGGDGAEIGRNARATGRGWRGSSAGPSAVGGIMSTTSGRVHLAPGVPM